MPFTMDVSSALEGQIELRLEQVHRPALRPLSVAAAVSALLDPSRLAEPAVSGDLAEPGTDHDAAPDVGSDTDRGIDADPDPASDTDRNPDPDTDRDTGCAEHAAREDADCEAAAREAAREADGEADRVSAAPFEAALAAELARLQAGERLKAAVEHDQLTTLARMHATATAELSARHTQSWAERTPLSVTEAVVMEVVTATGLSAVEVSARLELATATTAQAGLLRELLAAGRTTGYRACQLLAATRHLDAEAAVELTRAVLAPTRDGAGLSGALFRQRLRRGLLAADPDQAGTRRVARCRIGAFAQITGVSAGLCKRSFSNEGVSL